MLANLTIPSFLGFTASGLFALALLSAASDKYLTHLDGYCAVIVAVLGLFVAILWVASLVGTKLTLKEPCNVVIGGMFVGMAPTLIGVAYHASAFGKPTIFVGIAMMIAPSVAAMTAKYE